MGFHMYIPFLAKMQFLFYFFQMINRSNVLVEYPALFPKICLIMAVNCDMHISSINTNIN